MSDYTVRLYSRTFLGCAMKRIISEYIVRLCSRMFLVILIFFVFSCKGTPKHIETPPDFSQTGLIEEEAETPPEAGDADSEFVAEDDGETEIAETEITDETFGGEDIETAGLTETETSGAQTAVDEAPSGEPAPVVETAPAVETPEVVQAPPAPPEPAQTPPAPVQPPPVPPPALLGPAEERPSTQVRDGARVSAADPRPAQGQQPSQVQQSPQGQQPSQERRSDGALRDDTRRDLPLAVPSPRDDFPLPSRSGVIIPRDEEIIFSRTVRVTVGQMLEIPFRGTGWIYLGELASRRGIAYNSSRPDSEGQSIIFKVEEAGTYVLKFYKRDHIRDYILNDHVQVIASEVPTEGAGWFNPPVDRGRVAALPRWPSALDEAAIQRGGSGGASGERPPAEPFAYVEPAAGRTAPPAAPTAQGAAPLQGTAPSQGTTAPAQPPAASTAQGAAPSQGTFPPQGTAAPPPLSNDGTPSPLSDISPAAGDVSQIQERLSPEDLLKKAKETFDEGNVQAAIALLDQFREYYPYGSDELYWLYGQFYEANTPYRNILLSLDNYRRLVREYPQSSRLNDARRRIAYLERFYINIQ